jgi:hypothetical protein
LLGTSHHSAFDAWWEHASDHYISWSPDGRATGIDLYYDPVVEEHVGHGPVGLIAPGWYLAPQRREVGEAAWSFGAMLSGAAGDGPVGLLDNPTLGVMLAQLAGEFAEPSVKARVWEAADAHFEPTWSPDSGEFTFGFGLGEEHPRGQWNARAMAGWVCTPGAWSSVFNRPNLTKFSEPEVVGVDFPRVALREAAWTGSVLRLSAAPQRSSVRGSRSAVRVVGAPAGDWTMTRPDGEVVPLGRDATGALVVELVVDDSVAEVSPAGREAPRLRSEPDG